MRRILAVSILVLLAAGLAGTAHADELFRCPFCNEDSVWVIGTCDVSNPPKEVGWIGYSPGGNPPPNDGWCTWCDPTHEVAAEVAYCYSEICKGCTVWTREE